MLMVARAVMVLAAAGLAQDVASHSMVALAGPWLQLSPRHRNLGGDDFRPRQHPPPVSFLGSLLPLLRSLRFIS
jgi:hypothetical protein